MCKAIEEDSETEIIYQMHIDRIKYVELFDVHFNNPKSPRLTNENKSKITLKPKKARIIWGQDIYSRKFQGILKKPSGEIL